MIFHNQCGETLLFCGETLSFFRTDDVFFPSQFMGICRKTNHPVFLGGWYLTLRLLPLLSSDNLQGGHKKQKRAEIGERKQIQWRCVRLRTDDSVCGTARHSPGNHEPLVQRLFFFDSFAQYPSAKERNEGYERAISYGFCVKGHRLRSGWKAGPGKKQS